MTKINKHFLILLCTIPLILSLFLTSCETTKSVPAEIAEKYPLLPVEKIIESSRTQQELMSDMRLYFEDIGSTLYKETDASLVSVGFALNLGEKYAGADTFCTFGVNTEFKDDGVVRRIRFRTANIKYSLGEHAWFTELYGIDTEKELQYRIIAGEKYNTLVEEIIEMIQKIAEGKTKYTW